MSNELKQPDMLTYHPKQAMIIYATNPAQQSRIENKYYVEISDVMLDGGKAYIGAGKPVTKETLQVMMDIVAVNDKQTFHSITETVPNNLLVIDQRPGRNVIAWWRPAQRQTLMMQKKATITCWVPPLVFIVRNQRLAVASLNKSKRPSIATRLFHAPFFNVYNDMKVCLGNVKPPKTTGDIKELIEAWEKAFWKSEFTETVTGAYKQTDLKKWWRMKRRGRFNLKKLKQSATSLKTLCENL